MCENTPPSGRRVSTQFLVFPISTRVDITVYQHGKCFIFLKVYYICKQYAAAGACSARNLSRHFWAAYALTDSVVDFVGHVETMGKACTSCNGRTLRALIAQQVLYLRS